MSFDLVDLRDKQTGIKHWYAVYTKSRAEKNVYADLAKEGIECFLPTYKTLRQWSDRKKVVELPLFTSYVFVYITKKEYYKVLSVKGVVKYVSFEGNAVAIPNAQMDKLHLVVNSNLEIEITDTCFKEGQQVEVIMGSLRGLRGELVKFNRKSRVLVRIDHLDQNLLVNIPKNYLQ